MNAMHSASEFGSGKGHRDENFPVASWLLKPAHRAPILAFYRFARAADDIADHATASPAAKLERLDAMRAALLGDSDAEPTARALRAAMASRRLDPVHALDLLDAFTRDAHEDPTPDWDALIDYCRVSAMPVGRFVLDVHGEDRALWSASDALCAALQIVNHLQDCGGDWRALRRSYVPRDMLAAAGARVEDLGGDHAKPALRGVLVDMARRTQALLEQAAPFAGLIRDRRLGVEVAVIHALASDLTARLIRADPLATRVAHGKLAALGLAGRAALARVLGG